jgi:Peptidase family M1 domain
MKSIFSLTLLGLFTTLANAQDIRKQTSWQQEVSYHIDVELDDELHTLNGNISIGYLNNSPNALGEIYFHLWPNAYRDNTTDFARQKLLNGSTDFYFAESSERGNIENIYFKIDGKPVPWELLPGQPDICVISPLEPIQPGQRITITTPFKVNIPGSFSRFGHEDQSYQITQWYPKPAVYDANGWNPMSYLDQGEFYSEFGRFEVQITLPDNYVVAATGVLQEESEWKFLEERRDYPLEAFTGLESSSSKKTITYIQDSIHDFAWFASKYFNIEQNQVRLENGKTVGTFVFAPRVNISSTKDINKALTFYSNNCGYYPYDYCTVVQGPIKAGGGMEYPMITVVSHLGEEVIVHEVGHNWFYGMLGSNERKYPWMDESINTYFESKTMSRKNEFSSSLKAPKLNLGSANDLFTERFTMVADRARMHQPVELNSKLYSGVNFGLMVYGKGSKMFGHLHAYLGEKVFYNCFRGYFSKWAYRHPLPDDMKEVFEEISELDLTWFFHDMLRSEGLLDYKIDGMTPSDIIIGNNGAISAPYPIGFYKDGEMQLEIWQDGHRGQMTIPKPLGIEFDLVKIDPFAIMSEENRKNNSMRVKGLARKTLPFSVSILTGLENPNANQIYVMPIVGWNQYNKLSLGMYLGNQSIPQPNFRYAFTPLYSFETKDLNGYANFSYRWFRNASLSRVELGARNARFAFQPEKLYAYNKIAPYLKLTFRKLDQRIVQRTNLTLRYINTSFNPHFNEDEAIQVLVDDVASYNRRAYVENRPDQFVDLVLEKKNNRALNPSSLRFNMQLGMINDRQHMYDTIISGIRTTDIKDDFIKVNLTFNKRITYSMKKKGLDIRVFIGTYLKEPMNGTYQYRMGSQGGRYDYTFDQTVMGRNAPTGIDAPKGLFQRQILNTDMYMKQVGNFGNIAGWTAAANLKSNLPGKIPLGVYLDLFTFKNIAEAANNVKGERIGYSGGLSINIIPKVLEIYVPLFGSSFIVETQKFQYYEKLGHRITFMLNLNGLGNLSLDEQLNGLF